MEGGQEKEAEDEKEEKRREENLKRKRKKEIEQTSCNAQTRTEEWSLQQTNTFASFSPLPLLLLNQSARVLGLSRPIVCTLFFRSVSVPHWYRYLLF